MTRQADRGSDSLAAVQLHAVQRRVESLSGFDGHRLDGRRRQCSGSHRDDGSREVSGLPVVKHCS